MFSIFAVGFLSIIAVFAAAIVMVLRGNTAREWPFELSRVIGDAFVAIGRAPILFALLALSTSLGPAAGLMLGGPAPEGWFLLFVGLLAFAWYQFAMLGMVAGGLTALSGQKVRIGALARRVLPLVPEAMLVSLLFWIAVGIGFMLMIVPGVILACIWILVLPVMIAERPGVFANFGRSAALTRGVRWHLFLLTVIGVVFMLVTQGVFAALAAALGGGPVAVIAYLALASLLGTLPPALVASAYHTIVTGREGAGSDDLHQIFA